MIVIKEIEVILSGRNIIHFENLGYEISRHFNNKTKQLTVKKRTCCLKQTSLLFFLLALWYS